MKYWERIEDNIKRLKENIKFEEELLERLRNRCEHKIKETFTNLTDKCQDCGLIFVKEK